MNPDPIKTCKTCAYAKPVPSEFGVCWAFARCAHPSAERPNNLVTGEAQTESCDVMRWKNKPCGPDGLLWELKPEPDHTCGHVTAWIAAAAVLAVIWLAANQGG